MFLKKKTKVTVSEVLTMEVNRASSLRNAKQKFSKKSLTLFLLLKRVRYLNYNPSCSYTIILFFRKKYFTLQIGPIGNLAPHFCFKENEGQVEINFCDNQQHNGTNAVKLRLNMYWTQINH